VVCVGARHSRSELFARIEGLTRNSAAKDAAAAATPLPIATSFCIMSSVWGGLSRDTLTLGKGGQRNSRMALAPISHTRRGLRRFKKQTGQEPCAVRCGASG